MTISKTLSFSLLCAVWLGGSAASVEARPSLRWTLDDLDQDAERPYEIGHRGSGANEVRGPRPLENTARSVRAAYRAGVPLVEIDVQLTADGHVVALHDDFLSDWTPVSSLTLAELRDRVPQVSTLRKILRVAKRANASSCRAPSGLLIVELKQPSPLSDPLDVGEAPLVRAAVADVRRAGMTAQVMFESFSPALLGLAQLEAPEIARCLALSPLQLLTPEEAEFVTGLPVTAIDKTAGFGLQWAEVGLIYRLPGYDSVEEFLGVALALECRAIDLDLLLLAQAEQGQPGSGSFLVGTAQWLGLDVLAATATTPEEYEFLASLGVDGIYNDLVDLPGR